MNEGVTDNQTMLLKNGYQVNAFARSAQAIQKVEQLEQARTP